MSFVILMCISFFFFCKCDVLLKRNVQKQKMVQPLPLVLTWKKKKNFLAVFKYVCKNSSALPCDDCTVEQKYFNIMTDSDQKNKLKIMKTTKQN